MAHAEGEALHRTLLEAAHAAADDGALEDLALALTLAQALSLAPVLTLTLTLTLSPTLTLTLNPKP